MYSSSLNLVSLYPGMDFKNNTIGEDRGGGGCEQCLQALVTDSRRSVGLLSLIPSLAIRMHGTPTET